MTGFLNVPYLKRRENPEQIFDFGYLLESIKHLQYYVHRNMEAYLRQTIEMRSHHVKANVLLNCYLVFLGEIIELKKKQWEIDCERTGARNSSPYLSMNLMLSELKTQLSLCLLI